MTAWNANIPQPTDLISTSQGQILQNNQSINSVCNDATNGNFTKYVLQNVGTIASVIDPISVLHAINGTGATFNGHPIPYFKNSVGDFPLMPDISITSPAGQTNYFLKIGNLIINYGTITGAATATYTITFPAAYNSTSTFVTLASYQGTFTAGNSVNFAISNLDTTHSLITAFNAATRTFNYLAIGY